MIIWQLILIQVQNQRNAGAGEYPVGVSMVYSALKETKGAPVEVVLPKEGLGWEVEANALIKKIMKNEKLAQAF